MAADASEAVFGAPEGLPLLPLSQRLLFLPGNSRIESVSAELDFTDGMRLQAAPPVAAWLPGPLDGSSIHVLEPSCVPVTGEDPVVSVRTGSILNAVTVAVITVNPWSWNPGSGELALASRCRLDFQWETKGSISCLSPLQASSMNFRLESLAERYGIDDFPRFIGGFGETDCLVITGSRFTEALNPLVQQMTSRGYTTEVLAVEDISGGWAGADLQEDIRNCIAWHAMNEGTAYVLLGGDEEVIPPREVFTDCEGFSEFTPSDLYYADIQGSWDGNGNGVYGEWEDSLDLYPDVILGRLLFSTVPEAQAIVSKNLEYSSSAGSWYDTAVLCGAQLFPDIGYTGERGCELTAEGLPGSFQTVKAYEAAVGDYPDTYMPVLYQGAGWNHYAGHGTYRGVYWGDFSGILTVWRMDGFDNQGRYGIHSGIGCHTGDFGEQEVSLADTLLTLQDGGGVACLFNTTWGWEGYWPEIGSSERLCMYTVGRVYDLKASTLGLAYASALDLEIPAITGPYDRVMQSVLGYSGFMDPTLEVLGVTPAGSVPPAPFRIILQGPNPATASLAFRITGSDGPYDVGVYDISGRNVAAFEDMQGSVLHSMDLSEMVPGVYFLRALSSSGDGSSQSFVRLR